MGYRGMRAALVTSVAIYAVAVAGPAWAQTKSFNVPAQAAITGIPELARQADIQILVSESAVRGKTTKAVHGDMSVAQALSRLLRGTGLRVSSSDGRTFTLSPSTQTTSESSISSSAGEAGAASAVAADERADIVVTGSHIKGAPSASPVIRLTQKQMRDAGQYSLADALRDLPQNFSGGQNPGVGQGASIANLNNQNITGATSINLRGLGPDATLTLLNGRRLSYDSVYQGVDISAIPFTAVDRIEIVADGASALYGSDAVAGVANVIIKRDYEGVSTGARLATSTDGGDFEQQYDITAGSKWSSGGFIATYQFDKSTAIFARQRDYTEYLPEPYMLLPSQRAHGFLFSGHQDFGSAATFSIDALYNNRISEREYTITPAYTDILQHTTSIFISPSLTFKLPSSWSVTLNGVYGNDNSISTTAFYRPIGTLSSKNIECRCNALTSAEASGEGPLFHIGGSEARLAIGGGYRHNKFRDYYTTLPSSTEGARESYYAYGEISIPIVSADADISLLKRLTINGAARYEHYSDFGGITTPKLGLIYAPLDDIDFKVSWGRSFKAPTLQQESSSIAAILYPASLLGATGYPANRTVLQLAGGNPKLQPERAETWSATAAIHPRVAPGLQVEISYFNVRYRNRVVQPVANPGTAFTNAAYREFILMNPTPSQLSEAIGKSPHLLFAGGAIFDPNTVIAILNNQYTNASYQRISGADVYINYTVDTGLGLLGLTSSASWIDSKQRTSSLAPVFNLAGSIYNPPRFRARAGGTWKIGSITASSFINHLSGVFDTNQSPYKKGGSMTTADLALTYSISNDFKIFNNTELSFSVSNITNSKPPYLKNRSPYYVAFDSTNYSAIGRIISISLRKSW